MYVATQQVGVQGQETTNDPTALQRLALQTGRPSANFVFTPFYTPSILPVDGEACLAFLFVNTTRKKIQVAAYHFYDFEHPPGLSIEPFDASPRIRCTVQPQSFAYATFGPKMPKQTYFRDQARAGDYASLIRVGYFFADVAEHLKVDDPKLLWVEGRAPIRFV